MPMTFYDRMGKAVTYTEDDVHLFLYSGHPAGYIVDGSVYSYSGRHLGTIRSGWLRDHGGQPVFFSNEAVMASGLEIPAQQVKPRKLLKKPKPPKGRREPAPARADEADGWSELSTETFFIP
jgi:hypothetical protein